MAARGTAFVTVFLFVTFIDRISRYSRGLGSVQCDNSRVAYVLFVEDDFIERQPYRPEEGLHPVGDIWKSLVHW